MFSVHRWLSVYQIILAHKSHKMKSIWADRRCTYVYWFDFRVDYLIVEWLSRMRNNINQMISESEYVHQNKAEHKTTNQRIAHKLRK